MPVNQDRRAKLLAKFRLVAQERVSKMEAALGALEKGHEDTELSDELMREIHTLKGESRLMDFLPLNEASHVTEDLLAWARDRRFRIPAEVSDLVYGGLDLLRGLLAEDAEEEAARGRLGTFTKQARRILEPTDDDDTEQQDGGEGEPASAAPSGPQEPVDHGPKLLAKEKPAEGPTLLARWARRDDLIRISSEALAGLTNLSADLLLRHESITRVVNDLAERSAVLEHDTQQSQGESLLSSLRRLREQQFEAGLQLEELQDCIRELRLREVETLFERYPPAIRELARSQGKRVRVHIEGSAVSFDKQVLDQVDEAMLHLVRNSVDHGLETPEERRAAGKGPHGTIVLGARQLGAQAEVWVRDDGCGVDPDKVRATAAARGLIPAGRHLDDEEALQLVFRPGFSTRPEVTDISGRGVGLDVVKVQVESLGGSVRLTTRAGVGTTFTMRLPISVSLTRTFLFDAGGTIFGLPSAHVEAVVRASRSEVQKTGKGRALRVEGALVPLLDIANVFDAERQQRRETLSVVVVHYAEQRLGLMVDTLIGERQSVQQPLGRFFEGLRTYSSTLVLGDGVIGLVLNVPELMRLWGEGGHHLVTVMAEEEQAVRRWRVLVVDDSELTRDMLIGVTNRMQLETVEAVDGKDGLARVWEATPDLILTDLDMPVMDGFELIRTLREDAITQEIPVVVLSTRGSAEDKRRAMEAGANGYLVKSEFSEAALRGMLGRFLELSES